MQALDFLKQSLFRWKSDGTTTFRLGQRRVFILPTRGGMLFALALIVMLIGAINYNLALGHALVFLLAGLGITGMIHTFRNLFGLLISPGRPQPVFSGETAFFPLQISNDRSTPRLALSFSAEAARTVDLALTGNASVEIQLPLTSSQRGWLELPRVRLSSTYPLGLFIAWSYLQPAMRCLIYPKPLNTPLPMQSQTSSDGQSSGDGGQEDFAGFRDRQPADSPRHIAWKASARHDGERPLLLKQFSGGAEMELSLDWNLTDTGLTEESRLSQLTGWVLAADADNACYGLRIPGHEIQAAKGHAHRTNCLEALALFKA